MRKYVAILFKGEMVRAIRKGEKTQTRRIAHPDANMIHWNPIVLRGYGGWCDDHGNPVKCKWSVGDTLWVRESIESYGRFEFSVVDGHQDERRWISEEILYCADNPDPFQTRNGHKDNKWRRMPSIHMPAVACRIFLEVVDVRIERLKDISEDDALAEGIDTLDVPTGGGDFAYYYRDYSQPHEGNDGWPWIEGYPIESYKSLWEKINGKGSWDDNPWVWVIEFKPLDIENPFKKH